MAVTTLHHTFKTQVAPARMFRALILDSHNICPKLMFSSVKNIEFIQGDGEVGTIKQINFTEGPSVVIPTLPLLLIWKKLHGIPGSTILFSLLCSKPIEVHEAQDRRAGQGEVYVQIHPDRDRAAHGQARVRGLWGQVRALRPPRMHLQADQWVQGEGRHPDQGGGHRARQGPCHRDVRGCGSLPHGSPPRLRVAASMTVKLIPLSWLCAVWYMNCDLILLLLLLRISAILCLIYLVHSFPFFPGTRIYVKIDEVEDSGMCLNPVTRYRSLSIHLWCSCFLCIGNSSSIQDVISIKIW